MIMSLYEQQRTTDRFFATLVSLPVEASAAILNCNVDNRPTENASIQTLAQGLQAHAQLPPSTNALLGFLAALLRYVTRR